VLVTGGMACAGPFLLAVAPPNAPSRLTMATAMARAATTPTTSKERAPGKPTGRRRSLIRLATRPVAGPAGRSGQLRSGGRATKGSSATGAGTSPVAAASESPVVGTALVAAASESPVAGASGWTGWLAAVSGAGATTSVEAAGPEAEPGAACARPRRRRRRLGGGSSVSEAIRSMAAASSLGLRCGALKLARRRLGAIGPDDRHPDPEIAAFGGRLGERSGLAPGAAEGAATPVQSGARGAIALLLSPKGREDGI
jgi:hypothetical protein